MNQNTVPVDIVAEDCLMVIEKDTEKKMSEQLTMFDKIGDHCLACNEPFDKTDKEQVKTWTVVVRKKTSSVL